ncbi:hypothetical protein EVAR_3813_1 [Eumeta japonica]|uniref:Uncharacterized protein n=1 Tax=Eumeta variegata TaxID=151549 RepID=A0A4C1SSL5_EUMVA|nr:hypothetical protein EVAR_3813_1 [Eumeta japonica]
MHSGAMYKVWGLRVAWMSDIVIFDRDYRLDTFVLECRRCILIFLAGTPPFAGCHPLSCIVDIKEEARAPPEPRSPALAGRPLAAARGTSSGCACLFRCARSVPPAATEPEMQDASSGRLVVEPHENTTNS